MAIFEELITQLISKFYFFTVINEQSNAVHLHRGKAVLYRKKAPVEDENSCSLEELAVIKEKGISSFLPFKRNNIPEGFYRSSITGLPKSKNRWEYKLRKKEADIIQEYGWWLKVPFIGIPLPEGFRRHLITRKPMSLDRYSANIEGPKVIFYVPFEIDSINFESRQWQWVSIKDLGIPAKYYTADDSKHTDSHNIPDDFSTIRRENSTDDEKTTLTTLSTYSSTENNTSIQTHNHNNGLPSNLNLNIRYWVFDLYKAYYGPNHDYVAFMLAEASSIASKYATDIDTHLLNTFAVKQKLEENICTELNDKMVESGIEVDQVVITDQIPFNAHRVIGLEEALKGVNLSKI